MTRKLRLRIPKRARGAKRPGERQDPAAPAGAGAGAGAAAGTDPDPDPGRSILSDFDPFPEGENPVPDPALTASERREAEKEARAGVPAPEAAAPSPGERRVESRFARAGAAIRARADEALGRLDAAHREARTRAVRLESEAGREREHTAPLSGALPAFSRIEARYEEAQAAQQELAGFRRECGLSEYASPRQPSRGWAWLLAAVALAETTANGLLLHSVSTEGILANWTFAALVTAMNVGLLGWLIGDLILRRMLRTGMLRRVFLAAALVPCLSVGALLHFGFAHYRDAAGALDTARRAAVLDLEDIDAGAAAGGGAADPHPPTRLSVEEAVIGELRAQFLWWRPGAVFTDHPEALPPTDHSQDTTREVAAGGVGYRARDGALVQVEDSLAGRFEGWRSVLLLAVGILALFLSAWKWFGGREPLPHFARLHRQQEEASRALEEEYRKALDAVNGDEREHRRRLGTIETDILALGTRLEAVSNLRRQIVSREGEFLRQAGAAGASAIEDYREANRQQRLSGDPPPAFWREPWRAAPPPPREAAGAAWERDQERGLVEIAAAADRVRIENAAHAPEAAAAFESVRERLAQAARLPGARRRPPPPRGEGPSPPLGGREVRLLPRGPERLDRLEAAS